MLMFVSHYYGTFSAVQVETAEIGSAAWHVGNGEYDYTYTA